MDGDRIWPGRPYPPGAVFDGEGTNFAVYARHADAVELCLFDPADPAVERRRLRLGARTGHVWHAYLPGVGPGTPYGYRAHGPYEPEAGHRYNPAKLLVDPYARELSGQADLRGAVFGYRRGAPDEDLTPDPEDSAPWVPRALVVGNHYDWEGDRPPRTPLHRSVLYELHVRGFTMRHPEVPPELRGTYAGLASPPALEHLTRLGVTAVELLPVHAFVDDAFLLQRGLRNYWGYSTLAYLAPEPRYAARRGPGEQVNEFRGMVKALHRAGVEVILDVVFNHTCEGNHLGPTLSLKGLDNRTYYRLAGESPRYYADYTGTGNSLDLTQPQTLALVMDSLRCWVNEMHVDGFRFDLAVTLARDPETFDEASRFLAAVHQDPVLRQVKLIAEPWDVGPDGYKVGAFPVIWSEWNGKYRDVVRRFWKGDEDQQAEMGYRLTGSADLYEPAGRKIYASVNFVTAHDGFTLRDLVSYDQKHNEANGEENRDGTDENFSWNCGAEGETDDPAVLALRERQQRNLMATLLVSQGVPMIAAGDEMGKTQRGNNNAYCHDDELSWLDWDLDERRRALLAFTRRMIRLRLSQPVLQRRSFFRGAQLWDSSVKDLAWFRPDGAEMTQADWDEPFARSVAFLLGGDAIASPDEHGERIVGDTLLVLLNAHHEPVRYVLPAVEWGRRWLVLEDTAAEPERRHGPVEARGAVEVEARSLVILARPAEV
ncbi:glycogen debranching enzyme GlgX [Anaeromyxobacter sp. K]|uniref:glycogen debranching protein GlgX n=1 Tax=Anaeromyxobacter sp. (strain K) TaxID=447217 RepID=UPI00015F94BA|nr:glycogen debranching protein GlgX [Anaeromyxobacter sp. K]ACG72348.1 glycogen debranching enzyme GlgX [Anaeromyxobacter sp. K]